MIGLEAIGSAIEQVRVAAGEALQKGVEIAADTLETVKETTSETVEKNAEVCKTALEEKQSGGELPETGSILKEKISDIRYLSPEQLGARAELGKRPGEALSEMDTFLKTKLNDIRYLSPERLTAQTEKFKTQIEKQDLSEGVEDKKQFEGLTDSEKKKIKEETGWSDEIIDAISSMEEYEIYKKAGLQEAEINGRKCLIRGDIDWEQKDEMGRTNRERVQQGLSPYNKDGKVIELHHIGQHADSPLAELTQEEHRGKENYHVLHHKSGESEIDRAVFGVERAEHWENRATERSSS